VLGTHLRKRFSKLDFFRVVTGVDNGNLFKSRLDQNVPLLTWLKAIQKCTLLKTNFEKIPSPLLDIIWLISYAKRVTRVTQLLVNYTPHSTRFCLRTCVPASIPSDPRATLEISTCVQLPCIAGILVGIDAMFACHHIHILVCSFCLKLTAAVNNCLFSNRYSWLNVPFRMFPVIISRFSAAETQVREMH
jgi:hypothetical protein